MANTNKTGTRDFAEKKTYSVSAATLRAEDFDGNNPIAIFNLPEKSLVTATTLVVNEEDGGDGGFLQVSIGSKVAIQAASIDEPDDFTPTSSTKYLTGTGKQVTVTPVTDAGLAITSGSAAPAAGEFTVIVEYIEYTLGTLNLTNYSED